MEDENHCKFLSLHGVVKACNHSLHYDMNNHLDIKNVKNFDSIYVHVNYFEHFIYNILPQINSKFYLYTGCSDISPEIYPKCVEIIKQNDYIIYWYAQNCNINHSKIKVFPLGLAYHYLSVRHDWNVLFGNIQTPLKQEKDYINLINEYNPVRKLKINGNFHFEIHRGDRQEAYEQISKDLIDYETVRNTTYEIFKKYREYAFVASPYGYGFDCYRTWEALIMGAIPIVKKGKIDLLYEGLPVLLIDKWADINEELLKETYEKYQKMQPFHEIKKLHLNYWLNN